MKHVYIEATSLTEHRMSGIGHSVLEIVRALEQHPEYLKSFDVTLVTSYDTAQNLARWGFKDVRIKRIYLPLRLLNILWKFNLLPPMDIFMKQGVFVFPNYKNWRLLRSKSITYIHDIGFVLYPQYVSPKNQKFLVKNMPKWIRRTDRIAADSQSAADEIAEAYGVEAKNKVSVVHHGVDTDHFYKRSTPEVHAVREKYALPEKFILYLGNIEPRKNIEGLIAAYKKLPKHISDSHELLLVGGLGWLNEGIFEQIAAAKQEGYMIRKLEKYVIDEDLPALYSEASVVVLPSHYEGFGLSLVQSMACQTPVVAGNNSSMIEVVGDGGILVDQTNSDSIADGLQKAIDSPLHRKELAAKGLAQANSFSWHSSAQKLLQIVNGM